MVGSYVHKASASIGESAPLILMRFLRTCLLNITERDLDWLDFYIQQHFLFPREIGGCLVFFIAKISFCRQKVIFCRFGRTSHFGYLCQKNNYAYLHTYIICIGLYIHAYMLTYRYICPEKICPGLFVRGEMSCALHNIEYERPPVAF